MANFTTTELIDALSAIIYADRVNLGIKNVSKYVFYTDTEMINFDNYPYVSIDLGQPVVQDKQVDTGGSGIEGTQTRVNNLTLCVWAAGNKAFEFEDESGECVSRNLVDIADKILTLLKKKENRITMDGLVLEMDYEWVAAEKNDDKYFVEGAIFNLEYHQIIDTYQRF